MRTPLIVLLLTLGVATSGRAASEVVSPHGDFREDCALCHLPEAWAPVKIDDSFDHSRFGFPLEGAHKDVPCLQCHLDLEFSSVRGTSCADCHEDVHLGELGTNCAQCHSTRAFIDRAESKRRHMETRFPLTGAHVTVDCSSCHLPEAGASMRFVNTPTDCQECHLPDYQATTNPNHVDAGFPTQCDACHNTTTWSGAGTFDHNLTRFPLTGAHLGTECLQCHVGGRFEGTPMDCFACHEPDFNGTTNPDHVGAGFATDCAQCHTTAAWQPATFDHDQTDFPLTGAHLPLDCAQCHVDGQFSGTPMDCFACHSGDYSGATDPNHAAAGFPTTCVDCHTTTAWAPSSFDHDDTGFSLTGAHQTALCSACHVDGQFEGTPNDCWSCHQPDFDATTNPNHQNAGFGQDCTVCHNTTAWQPAQFDHNANTDFPLTGAHIPLDCAQCHVDGQYTGTPMDCFACHSGDYNSAADPDHAAAGFPTTCADCHTTAAWKPSSFNHDDTGFSLTGAHRLALCSACHVDGQFAGTPNDCWSCHQPDFDATTNPNHQNAGFGQDCTVCHTTTAWQPAQFDHNANTDFPLTGAHIPLDCAQCHVDGQYTGTPMDCFACHSGDYNSAADPDHAAAGFPTTCADCHTTAAWVPSSFNHDDTGFSLTGAHQLALCSACHVDGQFAGTPNDCWSCHQPDYNGSTNPDHASAGFPTSCDDCHTTTAWSPASFDHNLTSFPLTGAHMAVDCVQCHIDGQFTGTPMDCFACHSGDYNSATDPNHVQSGFPTTCADCHTTTAWTPASFDHNTTGFPLTGRHTTVQCTQCHVGGQYSGTPTDCYACHQTDYNGTNNPNHAAAGFPTSCTDCHSTSGWTPADWDHDSQYFPIYSGKHQGKWNNDCTECHVNPNNFSQFECILCHEHSNRNQVDNDHRGENGYQYNSAACYNCHPRGRA